MLLFMTKFRIAPTILVLLITFISGCASQQSLESADTVGNATSETPQNAAAPIEKASFRPSTLYALLVAEMAAHRGLPRVTLHNYLQEAKRTRDPGIVRRAVQLAGQLRDANSLLKASLLWTEVEPTNPLPLRIATRELIRRGEADYALPLLEKALAQNSIEVVDALASRAQKMSEKERQSYLELLDRLLESQPDEAHLLYAKASLVVYQQQLDLALQLTKKALDSAPDFDRAVLLEADLQSRTGHLDTALGHLREELEQRDHKQMRTLYTRLLLEKKQYPLADQQGQLLTDKYPNDYNLQFYLGVLTLEHSRLDSSEVYFRRLSDTIGNNSALSYYHGRIAQLRDQQEAAMEHYLQVKDAPYLLASFTEVSRMLGKSEDQKRLASIFSQGRNRFTDASPALYALEAAWLTERSFDIQAMLLLDQAITDHPDNTRLRYSRAMLGEKQGNMELLESDLRYVLRLEPDNATVLNALGYSLTDNTDRHTEALELIEKALALKPDDPAILDSMGWAHYHLGNLSLAIQFLERAYKGFPDAEIAAHLGTVYWAVGDVEKARLIWEQALELDPDSQLIKDAISTIQKDI
ncbi:hypothetical protein BGP75_04770 [Motiliproteus sp. MSK22-1]|nr:hypothetical protein BGP75_04770 [Motiliproteus sp. MSK22-1]